MKKQLIIIIVFYLFFYNSFGQKPIKYANSFEIKSQLFNSNVFYESDGSLQNCSFTGEITWISNFNERRESTSIFENQKLSRFIYLNNKKNIVSRNFIYGLDKKKVKQTVDCGSVNRILCSENNLFYVNYLDNSLNIFDGNQTKRILNPKEKIISNQILFCKKTDAVYYILYFEQNFKIYKFKNNKLDLLHTLKSKYNFDLEVFFIN